MVALEAASKFKGDVTHICRDSIISCPSTFFLGFIFCSSKDQRGGWKKMGCVWITTPATRIFRLIFVKPGRKKRIGVCTIGACFLLTLTFFGNQQPTNFERKIHLTHENNIISALTVLKRKHKSIRTSSEESTVCEVHGDIQIQANASSINIYYTANDDGDMEEEPWRIKPYPRTDGAVGSVNEAVIRRNGRRSSEVGPGNPQWCTVNHTIPGIVFSLSGYVGNYYHEFSDLLLPLFLTSHRYDGEVRFLVTNNKSWFIHKYHAILNRLTNHDILDIDSDDNRVHCFSSHVIVGLYRHKVFGINESMPLESSSMADFARLIRLSFSLKRYTATIPSSAQNPRLLIVSRTGTRKFLNLEQMIRTSENLGYTVTSIESTDSQSEASSLVNSCDVMLGAHGAGLTNMVFLPVNATVVQIVPWGGIEWLARFCYRGAALDLGSRYADYSVGKEESSITEKFADDGPQGSWRRGCVDRFGVIGGNRGIAPLSSIAY